MTQGSAFESAAFNGRWFVVHVCCFYVEKERNLSVWSCLKTDNKSLEELSIFPLFPTDEADQAGSKQQHGCWFRHRGRTI